MKNNLIFQGEVKKIFPMQVVESKNTGKVYIKQECIVEEVGEQYPSAGTFEVFFEQGKQNKLDGINVGDTVEIGFNMRSNEYLTKPKDGSAPEERVSGSCQIWTLSKISAASQAGELDPQYNNQPATAPAGEGSDLPF